VLGLTAAGGTGHLGQPVLLDTETGAARLVPVGQGVFAGEAVPVTTAGGRPLFATLVLDSARECTELWLVDASEPEAGPVATARLPEVVPFGLHGSWVPAAR
jgi:carotenoid cleavage dioxygenase